MGSGFNIRNGGANKVADSYKKFAETAARARFPRRVIVTLQFRAPGRIMDLWLWLAGQPSEQGQVLPVVEGVGGMAQERNRGDNRSKTSKRPSEDNPATEVDQERRDALIKIGRFGAYTAPALLVLLSSEKALAQTIG
jgi:hypothetical protein